jgi:hypothetical protein
MVNANCEKDSIHNLAYNKLQNLILELNGQRGDSNDPCKHIYHVSDDEVSKQNVSHEEYQSDGELNLQFVEACLGPFA